MSSLVSSVRRLAVPLAVLACAALLSGCIPYTAATTAHPVSAESSPSSSLSISTVPNGLDLLRDSTAFTDDGATSYTMLDYESRFRIDERSDVGLRIPSASGAVVNYKRRLVGVDTSRFALAGMVGTGFVNGGNHAHFEATVIASGPEAPVVTPYGGVRAMQVVPLSDGAVSDTPTLGAFLGIRIGSVGLGVTPEIGVFYDEPALATSPDRNVVLVPSITIHGRRLLRALGGGR